MSDNQNGKNGKTKNGEIDRLLKLIDSIARVDTKLTALDNQYKIDIANIKEEIDTIRKDILDAEKRKNETIQMVVDLQKSFDKWKIYWSIIAFIGAPTVTTIIIWSIEHFLLHQW